MVLERRPRILKKELEKKSWDAEELLRLRLGSRWFIVAKLRILLSYMQWLNKIILGLEAMLF